MNAQLWTLKATPVVVAKDGIYLCNTKTVIDSIFLLNRGYKSHKIEWCIKSDQHIFISGKEGSQNTQAIGKEKGKLWYLYCSKHFENVTEENSYMYNADSNDYTSSEWLDNMEIILRYPIKNSFSSVINVSTAHWNSHSKSKRHSVRIEENYWMEMSVLTLGIAPVKSNSGPCTQRQGERDWRNLTSRSLGSKFNKPGSLQGLCWTSARQTDLCTHLPVP